MEFRVRYLALFLLFSVINGFGWVWVGQASGLWQRVELASEFESDLQDTVKWGRK